MKFVTRKQWKARSPRKISRHITPANGGVAIHYNGGKGKLTVSDHSKCGPIVRRIQDDHMDHPDKLWNDIAYTLLVCQHGYVFEGRGVGVRTAANGTTKHNLNYYAVMALINESDNPTDELIEGIKEACLYLIKLGGARPSIIGHRDCKPTSCPGTKLYKMVLDRVFNPDPENTDPNKFPGDDLKEGDRGPTVRKLQERLSTLHGYKRLKVDGWFGPITKGVVKEFQKKNKIKPTGVVDRETWVKIFL